MFRQFCIGGMAAVLIAAGGYFLWTGTPAAEPPLLVEINHASLEELKAEFNRLSDNVRVIVLFSPT